MSGVGTALESCDCRISACKYIHDFTFSFVSPLETKNYIKFHILIMINFCRLKTLEWQVIHYLTRRRIFRSCRLWLRTLLLESALLSLETGRCSLLSLKTCRNSLLSLEPCRSILLVS